MFGNDLCVGFDIFVEFYFDDLFDECVVCGFKDLIGKVWCGVIENVVCICFFYGFYVDFVVSCC